ncbi:MAG TPA: protoporphyrinogen oxidase [Vicinamibacterales bacterium]|nr:protoporphyrinogen oxidase [Vicinamibacterales bacterium]
MKRIVIAGGGIAGLATAWNVRRRDPSAEIVVLERASRAGGNIRTEVVEGYACEWGPDGFLDNAPATLRLVRELGLEGRLQPSNDAARRRFVYLQGRLHEVPTSFGAFLRSRLLSTRGKLRLLCEPFGRKPPGGDESIFDFAARRIGAEAASVLVDSMVSGVFAGDARSLSLRACFPRMWELERDYGSLVRAMIATRRQRTRDDAAGAPAGRLTSFTGGMSDLVDALTRQLGDVVRLSTPVLSLRSAASGGWHVGTPRGGLDADAVVLAGPASEAAAVLAPVDVPLATDLEAIPAAPLAVVCLGFDERAVGPLDGFGFLVPRSEKIRVLGALWETSIYPNRAPGGKALMRVMIGGAVDPLAAFLSDDVLVCIARENLQRTMGLVAVPEFVKVIKHRRGIPQYGGGHVARLERIAARLAQHPGLFLAGNSYRGVSINSCIAEADTLADTILREPAVTLRRAG